MQTAKHILRITVPALIGAAAAVWLAPMVGPATDAPPVAASPERPRMKANPPARAAREAADARRTAAAWARAASRDDADDADDSADAGEEDVAPPDDPLHDALVLAAVQEAPEDVYARLSERRDGYADRFATEDVDARWAAAAQANMRSDFAAITDAMRAAGTESFDLRDVACRSTMCVVEVEWASASAAIDHAERIALAGFTEPCALFLLGPPPDAIAGGGAFAQDVFFDCA